ncbi:MAG TPA: hypothetical protein PK413_12770 [Thermoanaerobaculia bacterium]|nr:hypothetical protein [Thermoanaerobaculia bacterium]
MADPLLQNAARSAPRSRPKPLELALRALVALGLIWLAVSLGREVREQARTARRPDRPWHTAGLWRYGQASPKKLGEFLDRARPFLPAGSLVAFHSAPGEGNPPFFRFLWASFFLPECELVPSHDPAAWEKADYWITYEMNIREPRLAPILEDPQGTVYRRLWPAEAKPGTGAP